MDINNKKITLNIEHVNKGKPPKVVLPWWAERWQEDKDKLDKIKKLLEIDDEDWCPDASRRYKQMLELIYKIQCVIGE